MNLYALLLLSQMTISACSSIEETQIERNLIEELEAAGLRPYWSDETFIFGATIPNTDESPTIENIASELFRIYQPFCGRRTYGRGAGYPLNACPADQPDKNGLLCYPKCRDGYIGVGPVCWEDCGNMTAVGFLCVGSSISFRLSSKHGTLLKQLCLSCSISPEDYDYSYTRIFVRRSYGRGVGSPMICSSELEQSGALCYKPCNKRYIGVGPVCWQLCPIYQPVSCGFGCAIVDRDCGTSTFDISTSVLKLLYNILGHPLVDATITNIIPSAAKGDWTSVTKYMTILAEQLADGVLPHFLRKFIDWPLDIIEDATKNTTLLVIVTAFNNTETLSSFIKFFRLDIIIAAFNHGLCDLRDDLLS